MSKYTIADEEDPELHIQQKLTQLERQRDKCNVDILANAVSLQGDLSYYLYEKHIPQEMYFEYKTQLNSIVKAFLKKCDCK